MLILKKIFLNKKSYEQIFYHEYRITYGIKPLHITFYEIIRIIKDYDGKQYLTLNPGNEQRIDLFRKYKNFRKILNVLLK